MYKLFRSAHSNFDMGAILHRFATEKDVQDITGCPKKKRNTFVLVCAFYSLL